MTYYCPECGHRQTRDIYKKRGRSTFSWTYDFVCENCDRIIEVEDWGYNYSEGKE